MILGYEAFVECMRYEHDVKYGECFPGHLLGAKYMLSEIAWCVFWCKGKVREKCRKAEKAEMSDSSSCAAIGNQVFGKEEYSADNGTQVQNLSSILPLLSLFGFCHVLACLKYPSPAFPQAVLSTPCPSIMESSTLYTCRGLSAA